ncbi:MAG: hypothetical protein ACREHE_08530 [Rhizomicrobium sp.]
MVGKVLRGVALIAGLLLLGYSICHRDLSNFRVCGGLTNGRPIVSLELARSPKEAQLIFGKDASTCDKDLIGHLNAANLADEQVIIPLYGVLFAFFFFAAMEQSLRLPLLGVALTVVAVICDYREDDYLALITGDHTHAQNWLVPLQWATDVKWMCLAFASALGGAMFSRRGGLYLIPAIVAMPFLPVTAATLIDHDFIPAMNGLLVASFGALWVMAAIAVVKPPQPPALA